ncbi:retinoblastoma-associated protein-like [Lytechinus pictus]|uniref:retinoblastoma-associated protein-like n=1 Tax=Lytechinus pictus TaxID=7653 RepID=UPI0030BA17AB
MNDSLANILSRLTLPVNVSVTDQAEKLTHVWTASERAEFKENETTWAVCAIYIATVNVKYGKGAPVSSGHEAPESSSLPTLSQLLHASNINIKTFFEHMGKVEEFFSFSDTVKSSLMALKQKYLITYAIFCKFEKLFNKLFKSPDEIPCSTDGSCDVSCDKKRVCWLLFLIAKGSMLSECSELVLPLHLMLSCVDYTLSKALPFTIRDTFTSLRYDKGSEDETNEQCLRVVCKEGGLATDSEEEVAMVKRSIFIPFINSISSEDTEQDVEGFPKMDHLESTYHQMYQSAGDINEVNFLTFDSTLTPPKAAQPSVPPSPDSTVTNPLFLTPVRRAVTTVQALKSLLTGARDAPSDVLHRYFEGCSVNPESAIEQRVEKLKELFVGHYVGEVGVQASELACTRFKLGLRFYYRIMETMLIKEEKRLSTSDFSTLLNNDAFHRSLLACALEVVMVTFGYIASPINSGMPALSSKLLFPWILDVFDLHSFNFIKVIESFVKNEPRLTEEARKHLQGIETQIVECLAWSINSPLFDALRRVRGIEVNGSLTQSPSSHTSAADMFLSPVRPGHYSSTHRPSNEATPPRRTHAPTCASRLDYPSPKSARLSIQQCPSPRVGVQNCPSPRPSHVGVGGQEKPGSVTLNMFFNKVLQLAYHRLHTMCNLLDISRDLNRLMWTCVEHCITNKSWLLQGRHLDQIIMCSMYGICKVRDCERKFKEIVNMYRGLPHALSQTYKNVYMGEGRESTSIIAFYNQVFIPNTREYIHKFQLTISPASLSPVPSRCQATASHATPIYQVPGASNFYISPMKDSPFKSPQPVNSVSSPSQMTPRTRTLYSFGETLSSERLREFNQQVARPDRSPRPSSKRLKLEELDGPAENGDGPSHQEHGDDETDSSIIQRGQGDQVMSSMQRRISQFASDSRMIPKPSSTSDTDQTNRNTTE